MKVAIKDFNVDMSIKSKGIEIGISDGEKYLGDLWITMTNVIWCKGKVPKKNGIKVSWIQFIKMIEGQS